MDSIKFQKKDGLKVILALCFLLIWLLWPDNRAFAEIYSDNFDDYSTGNISGQSSSMFTSWDGNLTISTTESNTASNSIKATNTGQSSTGSLVTDINLANGIAKAVFYVKNTSAHSYAVTFSSGTGTFCTLSFALGSTNVNIAGSNSKLVSTADSSWHKWTVELDTTDNSCRANKDDGTWSDKATFSAEGDNYLRSISLGGTDATGTAYFDTFSIDDNTGFNGETRIVEITPANNEVIEVVSGGGATTTVSAYVYVSSADLGWFTGVTFFVNQVDQNYLYGVSSASEYSFFEELLIEDPGYYLFSQDIWLPSGGYAVHARLQGNVLGIINPVTSALLLTTESQDDSNPVAQYHYYVVGENSYISDIRQNAGNQLENILSSTSTVSLADCNILSGFDFGNCVTFSLIPSGEQLSDFGSLVSNSILSKFPVGYFWNFYQLLLSTTSVSSFGVSAIVPDGIPGAGASVAIEINEDSLDMILNATTSSFVNASASSTASFYSITSYYWIIFVYLATIFYMVRRIIGSQLISLGMRDISNTKRKYL